LRENTVINQFINNLYVTCKGLAIVANPAMGGGGSGCGPDAPLPKKLIEYNNQLINNLYLTCNGLAPVADPALAWGGGTPLYQKFDTPWMEISKFTPIH